MSNHNCIICSNEFEFIENNKYSTINSTKFKICDNCMLECEPEEDFKIAKTIIDSYVNSNLLKNEAFTSFTEASDILKTIKK